MNLVLLFAAKTTVTRARQSGFRGPIKSVSIILIISSQPFPFVGWELEGIQAHSIDTWSIIIALPIPARSERGEGIPFFFLMLVMNDLIVDRRDTREMKIVLS